MIKKLHQDIVKGKITSTELTQNCLDEIDAKDKKIGAFLDVYKEEALELARKVDEKVLKGEEIGLLEGIPCSIKDNMCIEGKITTAASKILENYKAAYDATVIRKLKKAGSIFLGKNNLDEFAMGGSTESSAFKKTKNPLNLERVPGGSSGGSAAAVVAGMANWALGSDTGGSIRQPASFCGLVALKPTYGRVSRYGLMAMASSFDQIGPITKDVEDAAIILDAICGADKNDNTTIDKKTDFEKNLKAEIKGKKIGVIKNLPKKGMSREVEKGFDETIEFLEKQGAEIVKIEIPHIKYSLAVYYMMITSEVSSNLARFDGIKYGLSLSDKSKNILDVYLQSRETGFGDEVKRRIILGTYALSAGYFDAYYKKAQLVRELIKKEFEKAFSQVDVIATPTAPTQAFKIGEKSDDPLEMYLADIYTVTANVAMVPAISVPVGRNSSHLPLTPSSGRRGNSRDLPIGFQMMGKWWEEQELLNIAKGIEEGKEKA